jgi:hypothetical protein
VADDGKRSETICIKVTERMALDLLHVSTSDDRSVSDLIYGLIRQELYGRMVKLDALASQITRSDKVNREAE